MKSICYAFRLILCFLAFPVVVTTKTPLNADTIGLANHSLDLPLLLQEQMIQNNEQLSNAAKILNSMRSSPSCHQLAASRLIVSCQSVTGQGSSIRDFTILDKVKSLYSARLGICELREAGAAVPSECSPLFTPQVRDPRSTRCDLGDVCSYQLDSCLKVLESKPQWWTSYSNNRQNAAVLCQASRTEIEKDERLDHYEGLVNLTAVLSSHLNSSLAQSDKLFLHQEAIIEDLDLKRQALLNTFGQDSSTVEYFLTAMLRKLQRLHDSIDRANSNTRPLIKDLHQSTGMAKNLSQYLGLIFAESAERHAELFKQQETGQKSSLNAMVTLQKSIESTQKQHVVPFFNELDNAVTAIHDLNRFLQAVIQQQNQIDVRTHNLDKELRGLEAQALVLRQMTTQQTESQSQLAENMKISESLLKGVISSAANLEAIVGEVHASLSLVPSMKERSFFFHAGIFAVLYIYLSKPNTPKILTLVAFYTAYGLIRHVATAAIESVPGLIPHVIVFGYEYVHLISSIPLFKAGIWPLALCAASALTIVLLLVPISRYNKRKSSNGSGMGFLA